MTGPPEVWSSFTYDPRDPRYAGLRASDHDRTRGAPGARRGLRRRPAGPRGVRRAQRARRRDPGAGRPARRSSTTWSRRRPAPSAASRTPRAASSRSSPSAPGRSKRREAAFSFLGASLVTTAIWFATCFGGDGFDPYFFWPGFVIAFSLLHFVRVAGSHAEIVEPGGPPAREAALQGAARRGGPFG